MFALRTCPRGFAKGGIIAAPAAVALWVLIYLFATA